MTIRIFNHLHKSIQMISSQKQQNNSELRLGASQGDENKHGYIMPIIGRRVLTIDNRRYRVGAESEVISDGKQGNSAGKMDHGEARRPTFRREQAESILVGEVGASWVDEDGWLRTGHDGNS